MFRAAAATSLALFTAPALAQGWGGAAVLASDDVLRGVSQSGGKPSLQLDLHYAALERWFAGASAASVRRDERNALELDAYAGAEWLPAEPWSLRLAASHYAYLLVAPRGAWDYDEVATTLGWSDRAFFTLTASPDAPAGDGRRTALSAEVAVHWPLPLALAANAGVGRYERRGAWVTAWTYWNLGLTRSFGPLQAELSFIGAGEAARAAYYDAAGERVVASLTYAF